MPAVKQHHSATAHQQPQEFAQQPHHSEWLMRPQPHAAATHCSHCSPLKLTHAPCACNAQASTASSDSMALSCGLENAHQQCARLLHITFWLPAEPACGPCAATSARLTRVLPRGKGSTNPYLQALDTGRHDHYSYSVMQNNLPPCMLAWLQRRVPVLADGYFDSLSMRTG